MVQRKQDAAEKSAVSAPAVYACLLAILCLASSWHPMPAVFDFWGHAAVGRWIWQHKAVPHHTLFLWTAGGQPWIAHSWLSQLTFYLLMKMGGEDYGPYIVLLFTGAMVAASYLVIWGPWARRDGISVLCPFLFALAIMGSAERYACRPELFSSLFLSVLLVMLSDWRALDERWRRLRAGALVVLFILWVNFHGAVFLALALLFLTVAAELSQEKASRASLMLLGTAVASLAAIFLNPFGTRIVQALQPVSSLKFASHWEWTPVWLAPVDVLGLVNQGLLLLLAMVAWARNRDRRWSQLLWLVVMTVAFAKARRNSWLLALTSLSVMAANAQALNLRLWWAEWWRARHPGDVREPPSPPLGLRRGAHAMAVVSLLLWITSSSIELIPLRAKARSLPDAQIDFIRRARMPGRMLNGIMDASYFEWRLGGSPPLFIDSLDAYPDSVAFDYMQIINATPAGARRLDELNVGYVVLRSARPDQPLAPLAPFLAHSPSWALVYNGLDGTVWVRRS